jgi:hypothetical protein
MKLMKLGIFIFFTAVLAMTVKAQKWTIKNYKLGYRIFELSSVGNNPLTVTPLLKDPVSYQQYLNTIDYNSLYGNPEILKLHTLYLNGEWKKDSTLSRFWKKSTIQAGLLLTTRIRQDAGAIGDESYTLPPNYVYTKNLYVLTKNQQFLGANFGLNRLFTISKRFSFMTGLHAQGSFAITHYYQQRWDSSTYTSASGWITKTTTMPELNGINFFQWQVLVPLGLEYEISENLFFIRFELNLGIVGSQYRPRDYATKEAHGLGIWLLYNPRKKGEL